MDLTVYDTPDLTATFPFTSITNHPDMLFTFLPFFKKKHLREVEFLRSKDGLAFTNLQQIVPQCKHTVRNIKWLGEE